jgi:hypothetical protein
MTRKYIPMTPDQETKQVGFFLTKEAEAIMLEQMQITGLTVTELLNNAMILYPKAPAAAKKKLETKNKAIDKKKAEQKLVRLKIKHIENALNKLRLQEAALLMPS